MRSAVFAGAIFATVLASGCASTPGTNLGSPSASARATQPSSTAPSTTPTPGTPSSTCSKATPLDAAVVLTDWTHAPGYTVNLVAANGCVIASATARTWSGYSATAGQPVSLPTSESATRVYFLDGDSTLRFLGLDGSKGVAAQLPGSSSSKVAFSVSPDNTRLAFSVMSWGSDERHFTEQSYVEDLATGADRTELFTLTGGNVAEEPIGWINGDIVFGLLLSANQYAAGPTPPIFDAYHVANPLTGKRLTSICAGSGNAWVFDGGDYTTLPTRTAVLCRVGEQYQPDGTLELVSWSGSRRPCERVDYPRFEWLDHHGEGSPVGHIHDRKGLLRPGYLGGVDPGGSHRRRPHRHACQIRRGDLRPGDGEWEVTRPGQQRWRSDGPEEHPGLDTFGAGQGL